MPIVSSSHVVGLPQIDGRCYVIERHEMDDGEELLIEYGPVEAIDYDATMRARAIDIDQARADQALREKEREAAEVAVATVLDAAIKAGTINEQDVAKAGHERPAGVLAAAEAAEVTGA